MKGFLYYLDKFTAWLDFSWLVTVKKYKAIETDPYENEIDPLLRK
jgi:hypothetical protein